MFDYANSLKELKSLADDGLLTELEYLKAVGLVGDKFAALNKTQETYVETLGLTSKETDRLQRSMMELQMIQEAGNLIAQGFEDAILSGQKLSEVVRSLGRDLVRLVFNQMVTQRLASGIATFLGAPPIPGRAIGGPVSSGSPYVVGEKGPELFVPHASGTIVPNNKMGGGSGSGGGSVTVNYNIAAGVSRAELVPILDQERRRLKAEIPDMVRRGGGYRAAFA
jgi:phage-related minor tail protein